MVTVLATQVVKTWTGIDGSVLVYSNCELVGVFRACYLSKSARELFISLSQLQQHSAMNVSQPSAKPGKYYPQSITIYL